MADIFISHSGEDSEVAARIGERIRRERPSWSLFYDKDNIRAGQRLQERLREELTSCRVVLALLSRNWLGSPWCFTEAVTASFRGKDVVGIETEDLSADDLARADDPAGAPARSSARQRQSSSAATAGAGPRRVTVRASSAVTCCLMRSCRSSRAARTATRSGTTRTSPPAPATGSCRLDAEEPRRHIAI